MFLLSVLDKYFIDHRRHDGIDQMIIYLKSSLFWYMTACFMMISCLACSSILKMKAISSSVTPAVFHGITRHYIPEDSTIFCHPCLLLIFLFLLFQFGA
jgi:hypothetical protein